MKRGFRLVAGDAPIRLQERIRGIVERDVVDRLPAVGEIVVTIGPGVRAGTKLDAAHETWTRAAIDRIETPSGLPRQASYARCPAGLVRVTVECVERPSGGMSSHYGFHGYFLSLLVAVDEGVVWDARGERAT